MDARGRPLNSEANAFAVFDISRWALLVCPPKRPKMSEKSTATCSTRREDGGSSANSLPASTFELTNTFVVTVAYPQCGAGAGLHAACTPMRGRGPGYTQLALAPQCEAEGRATRSLHLYSEVQGLTCGAVGDPKRRVSAPPWIHIFRKSRPPAVRPSPELNPNECGTPLTTSLVPFAGRLLGARSSLVAFQSAAPRHIRCNLACQWLTEVHHVGNGGMRARSGRVAGDECITIE